MNDNFFVYLHRLELIAFFSGYPLVYAAVLLIAGNPYNRNEWRKTIVSLLPYSYALVVTLYLVFEIRNLYPDYSFENLKQFTTHPFLVIWAILAILFWIPFFAKRPIWTLLHSLVFFILLINDLFFSKAFSADDKNLIRNDMKLYTASILLNIISIISIAFIYFLFRWLRALRRSSRLVQ